MQNQDLFGPGLSSNPRVLVQPSNYLNQPMSSYSLVRYQPNNSVQLMANAHHTPQSSSLSLSAQVQPWNSSCENTHSQVHQQQQHQQQQITHQHARLKVEDALTYLDQVKLKFGQQPQVYNEFLDIMKEFKSQVIDTPGVIRKVSMLFQGHTELIVGFNTFLPHGYSIEVKENQTINVRQPGQQVLSLTNFNSSGNVPVQPQNAQQANPPHGVRQGAGVVEVSQNLNQLGANQGQPVQFNHAITYVNKIKSCYQGTPEIYKAFLDILHNYQKEQKNLKEGARQAGNRAPVTEAEVYAQVSLLFKDQPELLMEFRQFLPDANGGNEFMKGLSVPEGFSSGNQDFHYSIRNQSNQPQTTSGKTTTQQSKGVSTNSPIRSKSSSVTNSAPPAKRQKLSFQKPSPRESSDGNDFVCHDAELTKIVKKILLQHPNREVQCRDLLKQVDMLNRKLIDASEFYRLAYPLIEKTPELKSYLKSGFLKTESSEMIDKQAGYFSEKMKDPERHEKEWFPDLSTCPQHGKHYRILPDDYVCEKSGSSSDLCRKVLNETHSIYASPLSDTESDGDQVYRRNIYEDHVFQCEDERYELDMVIDLNSSVLKGLKKLLPKIQKMGSEDMAKFHIDDMSTAVGVSEVHIETALKRLYGEKYKTMMDGLKKCPCTAVPIVVKSLQAKDKEWKVAKKSFERIWSEQMDKFYLKSLDFQGLKFKQNDIKNIRSKSLIKEIENAYHDQNFGTFEYGVNGGETSKSQKDSNGLKLTCQDRPSYDDAIVLIMSSVSRQSAIQVEDQDKIRGVLDDFLPSILFLADHGPSQTLPKDCSDEEFNSEENGKRDTSTSLHKVKRATFHDELSLDGDDLEDSSTAFYCNDNWYILIRLVVILCERLHLFKEKARELSAGEEVYRSLRSEMTSSALQSRCPESSDPNAYYATFLTMVKNLTNGLLELSSFEDQLREMFGINSYVAFTIDKLIHNIIKQLQHVVGKDECVTLGGHYVAATRCHLASDQYEQKVKNLMADKSCFRFYIGKNSDGSVELFCSLTQPASEESNSSYANHKHPTGVNQRSADATKRAEAKEAASEASAIFSGQDVRCRKRRRKSSEVRINSSKTFGLNESSYSYRNIPDFVRKLKHDKRLVNRARVTPQNCLVQALESMASSLPNASPQHRSDYDNDPADHCLNEESSDSSSQRMLHDKINDKSEDDSSCSDSYRRFPPTGCTEIHVYRPGCLEKARENNWKIRSTKMKRFDKWKKKLDVDLGNRFPPGSKETFVVGSSGLLPPAVGSLQKQPNSTPRSSSSPRPNDNRKSASSPGHPGAASPRSPGGPSRRPSDDHQSGGNEEDDFSMS